MKSMILASVLLAGGFVSPQAADAHPTPWQHGYDRHYQYAAPLHYTRRHHDYCQHGRHWHKHAKHWRKHHARAWHDYRHWYGEGYGHRDHRHDGRRHRGRHYD